MKPAFPFLAILLAATGPVAAQVPPAPPAAAQDPADAPPPPPRPEPPRPGLRADVPPPGASIQIEKGPEGRFRIDLHCDRTDTTRACAEVAIQLIDKLEPEAPPK